jgi:hypothetical protein
MNCEEYHGAGHSSILPLSQNIRRIPLNVCWKAIQKAVDSTKYE